MGRVHAVKIVDVPHALRQLWSGQHPATSQTAQSVRFGQAAGNQKLFPKMQRWKGPLLEHGFQIDFIDQHQRIGVFRDVAQCTQRRLVSKCAARIVQVSNGDQPGARRDLPFDLFRIDAKSIFHPALEIANARAQVLQRAHQKLVGRVLDQDFVAWLDRCRHRQMVRHRGTGGSYDALGLHSVQLGQPFLQWRVAVRHRFR